MLLAWGMMLACAGCAPRIITQTHTRVKDSVIVREVTRIVSVAAEKDSAVLTVRKEERGVFEKKNKRAAVRVEVDSKGNIHAAANCDSVTRLVAVKTLEIERLRTEHTQETTEKTVYKTRGIDKFCRWATAALAAGAVLYFGIKKIKII